MTRLATTLIRDLQEVLRERPLVIWLDSEGLYSGFVQRLGQEGELSVPVVGFRGSYLETLLALEPFQNRLDPEPLLVHLPGHTDKTVRKTPFLELYHAGRRFQKNLGTLVRQAAAGEVPPDEVERYLASGPVSFQAAEAWLEEQASRDRRGLAGVLAALEPEWVFDELMGRGGPLRARLEEESDLGDLQDFFHRHTGFSEAFARFAAGVPRPAGLRALSDALASWVLCVEYVHDLTRPPRLPELLPLARLSAPLRDASTALARRLREDHPEVYRSQALLTEAQLGPEISAGLPEELGRIDTFSGEDSRLLKAAVQALEEERWPEARAWAEQRLAGTSFWLEIEPARRHEWELVQCAARFGQALQAAGRPLQGLRLLEEAVEAYTGKEQGARRDGAQEVDRAHRHFEELRRRKLGTWLPHASDLWMAAGRLRALYREWADHLARDFATICDEEGLLPPVALQQRTLYEQVVHPLVQRDSARVALFLVDALRYEMAAELASSLEGPGVTVHLSARLAELPTITAVGMNALAPTSRDGRLTLAPLAGKGTFGGFRCGEYTVRDPANRLRAMAERSLDRLPGTRKSPPNLDLAQLVDLPADDLKKKLSGHHLVVVHSREIDDSGEASLGLSTFDTWLGQLRVAVQKLRSLGLDEFVITSDHGFLLQDETATTVPYAGGRERDRRFAVLDTFVKEPDTQGATLSCLGYEGVEGYLLLPRDTRTFNLTNRSSATFVHGGNTLQERVIPVLTVSSRKARVTRLSRYRALAQASAPLLGLSRIQVKVEVAPGQTGLLQPDRRVALGLRVPNRAAEVDLRDASGAELVNQRLLVEVDANWAEVLFSLVGSGAERAQVEVYHPDSEEDVEPCRLEEFFEVKTGGASLPGSTVGGASLTDDRPWHSAIQDEGHRKVLLHLEQYGTVTEEQAGGMLGGPRAERRFNMRLQGYRDLLPFQVSMEVTASGKRYVKNHPTP